MESVKWWLKDNPEDLVGRIVATLIVFLLAMFFVGFVLWKKKNKQTKVWFSPYGLNKQNYLTEYQNLSFKDKLFKTDYKWWFLVSVIFLIYWFGAYFVVSILMLAQYNQFITNNTNGISFVWDNSLTNSSGLVGRYVLNGDESNLSFILGQTNVAYYMRNLEGYVNIKEGIALNSPEMNARLNLWLHSWIYSNVFITPLCQSLAVIFPLSIILSYKKDRASIIAPWALLGGSVTIFGGVAGDESIHVTWQFVLFDQQIFFMYHVFIMVVGFAWFTYANRYSLKRVGLYMAFIATYVFYVIVTAAIFNIQYFTTGMTAHDLTMSGSYEIVHDILGDAVPFPANLTIMLIVFVGVVYLLTALKNWIHWNYYWNQKDKTESFRNDLKVIWTSLIEFKNKYFSKKIFE